MMRLFNRILNLFRGRKAPKPVPAGPVKKEEYERWLGIWTVPIRSLNISIGRLAWSKDLMHIP